MEDVKEFYDKSHSSVALKFYDIVEMYYDENVDVEQIKNELKALIKRDPDYFDPYLLLYEILLKEGKRREAEEILNEAYKRAIEIITDEKGNWPDVMLWSWLENRHIIRTIVEKSLLLWENKKENEALDLFRKLLKTNPNDNPGVRFYILAIKMGMSLNKFEQRFNKGGFYDEELFEWFENNYTNFPEEFEWWVKAIEEREKED